VKYIINECLYNRSKLGGYSIDVRSNGGYIVGPGSIVNGNFYKIVKNLPISNIPKEFAEFMKSLDNEKIINTL